MNWDRLTDNEKEDFLKFNNVSIPTLGDGDEIDLNVLAQELFNRLQNLHAQTFTVPVVDLYIASQFKDIPSPMYTKEQIMTASPEEIAQFVSIFGVLPSPNELMNNSSKMNEVKERIIHILDLMERIDPITIDDFLTKLYNTRFCYEILTNQPVNAYYTVDSFYRGSHLDITQYGFDATGYEIVMKNGSQYLCFQVELHNEVPYNEEYANLYPTVDNMLSAFTDPDQEWQYITTEGTFMLPKEFVADVEIDLGDEEFDRQENVTYKFVHALPNDFRVLRFFTFV